MEDRKGGRERKDKEEEEKERSRRNREGRGRQSGWKRAQCWDPPTPTQLLAGGGGAIPEWTVEAPREVGP